MKSQMSILLGAMAIDNTWYILMESQDQKGLKWIHKSGMTYFDMITGGCET